MSSINEYPIRTTFLISNLDGLQEETTIRFSSGLDVAWSTFATEMVANVTRDWRSTPSPLKAERVANSAKIASITKVRCSPTDHLDATCLNIDAEYSYRIFLDDATTTSDAAYVNDFFQSETSSKLRDGTFQYILHRESPGTPLVVGNIPRDGVREFTESNPSNNSGSGGSGGLPGWAGFLIFLLVMTLIFVPLYYYLSQQKKKTPYNEMTWKDFLMTYFGCAKGDALPTTTNTNNKNTPPPEAATVSTSGTTSKAPKKSPPKKQKRPSQFPSNAPRSNQQQQQQQKKQTPKKNNSTPKQQTQKKQAPKQKQEENLGEESFA